VTIKIGRRGATPALVTSVQNAWRGTEVVKLRIHDDKVCHAQRCWGGSEHLLITLYQPAPSA